MSFFRPMEPPDPAPYRAPVRAWTPPHPGRLGGLVPVRIELARTAEHLVLLGPMEAHRDGVQITLETRSRDPHVDPMAWGVDGDEGPLRLGVAFADGRTSEANPLASGHWGVDPGDGPILVPEGGGGGGGLYRSSLWVVAAPAARPVSFFVMWRDAGIAERSVDVDSSIFLDAAGKAERLWEPLSPEEERDAMRRAQRHGGRSATMLRPMIAFGPDGPTEDRDDATTPGETPR